MILERELGIALAVADIAFELAACDAEAAGVLGLGPQDMAVQIERTVYDNRMKPVVFERIAERPDAFRYSVRASRG